MRAFLARYGGIALILSVTLNLFLAGVLAGSWLTDDDRGRRGSFSYRGLMAREDLSPESREQVRKLVEAHREAVRPSFRAMRDARREVRRLATADPLDRPALEAAMAEMRQRSMEAQMATHRLMLILAESLPPQDREKLFTRRPRRSRDARPPPSP